jgi:hypothetical protein
MKKIDDQGSSFKTIILISLAFMLLLVHFILLWSAGQQKKSLQVIRKQLDADRQDQNIIMAAETLNSKFAKEISIISKVFPTEQTTPNFIRVYEELAANYALDYSIKFNSTQPVPEASNLYLPLTAIFKIKYDNLVNFLGDMEKLPYLTHITSINIAAPDGISGILDVRATFKLYVNNPFVSQ